MTSLERKPISPYSQQWNFNIQRRLGQSENLERFRQQYPMS